MLKVVVCDTGRCIVTGPGDPWLSGLARDVPQPRDLLMESQKSMLAFTSAESRDFQIGDWMFSARPVRAKDATCLRCHYAQAIHTPMGSGENSLKIGDPLGAVLYGYKPLK